MTFVINALSAFRGMTEGDIIEIHYLKTIFVAVKKINFVEVLKANPGYFKQFSCKDVLFLNYDCPITEKRVVKWASENHFYYVLKGKKVIQTVNNTWELTTGSFCFIKKGACIVEQYFHEPFCIIVFILPDPFIANFISRYKGQLPHERPQNQSDDLLLPIKRDDILDTFCQSILPYFSSSTPPSEQMIELKFHELLLTIANNPENTELISYLHAVGDNRAEPLRKVMEDNFSYNLKLEEYANLCNRSLSSFKRDFKTTFGVTPGRWLIRKRLELACHILSHTQKPIAEVLLECGFENQAHFSKAFRSHFGYSPSQLKRKSLVV